MGVQIYLLDRRTVTLHVDGVVEKIGTARSFWKVTEIDRDSLAEIEAVKASLLSKAAPAAVMIAEISELPLGNALSRNIAAHRVLGWDEDRASVTDHNWNYLPVLGYAVKMVDSTGYALHEERDGLLYPLNKSRAIELEILDTAGRLVRRGQPSIIECRAVKPYLSMYAEAECLLGDGQTVSIHTFIEEGSPPTPDWYIGKRPDDVVEYLAYKTA